jgi:hypothetical protein
MEIEPLNKIYLLNHVHEYYSDPEKPDKKYLDKKTIGFFYSKEKALEMLEKSKKQPGFKNSPEGFFIDEYVVDSMYNTHINSLIEKHSDLSPDEPETLYSIQYQWEDEDFIEDTHLIAYFSTKEKALKALNELLNIPTLKKISSRFGVYEENINWIDWKEGFISLEQALKSVSDNQNSKKGEK